MVNSTLPPSLTLEERLHRTRDWLSFLGCHFELLGVAPEYARDTLRHADACRAAAVLCDLGVAELRDLLDALPAQIANWADAPRSPRQPRR